MAYKRPRAAFEADLQSQQSPFAFYGTPLPPLDPSIRDDGSYVPVWKQEVTDERGRKRLHGAFTGGFSAGYFNTVGSKEGWTPQTFVSSRTDRAKDRQNAAQQRAEDFMDEEDLAEQAESQKLQTAGAFAGLGAAESDVGTRNSLAGLFRPSGSTMGAELLQKMGWREGQGVGPKVRRNARGDQNPNAEETTHLFAPDNSAMITFKKKNDTKGLGFGGEIGLSRRPVSSVTEAEDDDEDNSEPLGRMSIGWSKLKANKKTPKKPSFGVGVLNDTGSDDEDPYEIGPRISYNKVIGGDKKAQKKKKSLGANPLLASKPVFISKKETTRRATSGLRKCHDGKFPLEGFVLSTSTNEVPMTLYPPPEIPEGWKSSKGSATNDGKPDAYTSTADAAKAASLDPKARAAMLGETALPGKSIFDYLSPAARERIASASGKQNLPAALNEAPPEEYRKTEAQKAKDLWARVPQLETELASAALARGASGWMPYAEDEAKRDRYRSFLNLHAGLSDKLPGRAPNTSVDDWIREMQEFAHAARVFRPMTGMMASRFTSSSTSMGATPKDTPLVSKPEPKPEDPAEAAAKIGMYGPMTRSVQQFFPTRLVCKRFNVKPPAHVVLDPGDQPFGEGAPANQVPELVTKSAIDEMLSKARFSSGGFEGPAKTESWTAPLYQPKQEAEVNVERNVALEAERVGDAVFKAVFGSDTEDED